MKPIYILILNLVLIQVSAQTVNIDPCAIFKEAMINQNIDTLDHYLSMDSSMLAMRDRINLMTFKGAVLIRKYAKAGNKRQNVPASIIDSSYQLFTDAINLEEDEKIKIGYRFKRYKTLSDLKPSYPNMLSDEKYFADLGYRHDQFGPSAHLAVKFDGALWVGAEVAVYGGLETPYNIKDGYGKTIEKSKYGKNVSVLIFSYLRSLEENISESKFSIFRIEAPLYIDITQFGFINTSDLSHWFYRPQIGVGYGRFSISYGYSIFFKRASRDLLNKHTLNFNTKFMF